MVMLIPETLMADSTFFPACSFTHTSTKRICKKSYILM
jgi:hypothetical protein